MSAIDLDGPITIDSGITLTIESGGRLVTL